jgi:hypothetical protein
MTPHVRTGLLVVAGCIALGGLLAAGVHFALPSASTDMESAIAHLEPSDGPQAATSGPATEPTPTPQADDADEEQGEADRAKTDEDEAKVSAEAPPVRYRATSVFGAKQRGTLACRIPGQDAFLVEWNSASRSAVAHFANARIAGSMQQRANASNTIDSSLQFALEDGGHSLSMSINDAGTMNASVDGRESAGTCSPA